MEQFEYLTILLEASARVADKPDKNVPQFTPKFLMPQLDEYGKQGWELISLTPVFTGKKQDVMLFHWEGLLATSLLRAHELFTHNYLAVFKRRLPTP